MGHKVSPKSLRVGYIQDWESRWFSPKDMPDLIEEDYRIRQFLKERFRYAALSKVTIERTGQYVRINLHTARPGVIIGKRGADIEELKKQVQEMTKSEAGIFVIEVKRPELDAQLVAESIAFQLEKQVSFRRAMKRAVERTMSSGAGGIKVMVAGRLGGAEIARTEWIMEGRVPLHTFRADIDYGFSEAHINMGRIGVKAWIFKKEFFTKSEKDLLKEAEILPPVPIEEPPVPVEAAKVVLKEAPAAVEGPVVEEEISDEVEIDEEEIK